MYLQRERRSPVRAVSAAKSAVLAGCARVLCEREGVASGARWRRCGACPWRSCTSGVECMAQLAVGGRCGARGRCGKGAVRDGHKGLTDGGNRRAGFLRCTAVGAGWRSVCSSCCTAATRAPVPPRTRRARTQTSEQRADPKGWHGRWGAGGSGGGGPLAKGATTPHLRGAASWRPGGKGWTFINCENTSN